MTSGANSASAGTVFAINTNGSGFTNLHYFNGNTDGANPCAGLILSGNTLYGTTENGGDLGNGNGTVFAINTNGNGFRSLYIFDGTGAADGANPLAGLTLFGNSLYGTTKNTGNGGILGTIFAVKSDGTAYANLHNFT